jgi:soluble epoxide hydrolase / lipid-phosphate phosphatase
MHRLESSDEVIHGINLRENVGVWDGLAYYMNHKANAAYNSEARNGGRLGKDKLVSFIHAQLNSIGACENLTEVTVAAGHSVHWEKPDDVNLGIVDPLCKS